VEKQFRDLRKFIQLSSSCQKPDKKAVDALLPPLLADIEAISRAKEAGRRDRDWFAHLSFIGEAGPTIGWVVQARNAVTLIGMAELMPQSIAKAWTIYRGHQGICIVLRK